MATAASATSILLRPYQQDCLQACLDAIKGGLNRIGASLPTGAGKVSRLQHIGIVRRLKLMSLSTFSRLPSFQSLYTVFHRAPSSLVNRQRSRLSWWALWSWLAKLPKGLLPCIRVWQVHHFTFECSLAVEPVF